MMQVYAWTVFPLSLTLWDVVIEIFHSVPNKIEQPKEEPRGDPLQATKPNTHNLIQCKHTNVLPTNIDQISSNTTHSDTSAMLYVFDDNEAVIKMIIKGRSPTMRHVSRTHRVALVVRQDQFGPQKSKSVTSTPNTNSQTS